MKGIALIYRINNVAGFCNIVNVKEGHTITGACGSASHLYACKCVVLICCKQHIGSGSQHFSYAINTSFMAIDLVLDPSVHSPPKPSQPVLGRGK